MDISAFSPQHRLDRNVKTERIEITSEETGEKRVIFKIPDEEMKKSFIDWNNPRNDEMRHSTIARQSRHLLAIQENERDEKRLCNMTVKMYQEQAEMVEEKLRSLPSVMTEERKQWINELNSIHNSMSGIIDSTARQSQFFSEYKRIYQGMIDNLSSYERKPTMRIDQKA